jgi:hypothetical protein
MDTSEREPNMANQVMTELQVSRPNRTSYEIRLIIPIPPLMKVLMWNIALDLWPCEQHYSNLDKFRPLLKQ